MKLKILVLQYLHVIDSVMSPTVARVSGEEARKYRAPDARTVLESSSVFGFNDALSLRYVACYVGAPGRS